MDHGRDPETGGEPGHAVAGHLPQEAAQLIARAAFEGLAHQGHAEQEQRQPADELQDVEDIHMQVSSLFFSFSFKP